MISPYLSRFQSTPPRGRRLYAGQEQIKDMSISIHSAARAETEFDITNDSEDLISIHSAARAETQGTYSIPSAVYISIHSAARAETMPVVIRINISGNFNPLRREGGDAWAFQRIGVSRYFNPLRREGGDGALIDDVTVFGQISIHSAARAETLLTAPSRDCVIFQSTPPRGRRQYDSIRHIIEQTQFQSTPPRGRRHGRTWHPAVSRQNFNPLRREGGDGTQAGIILVSANFNPLRREGGDCD